MTTPWVPTPEEMFRATMTALSDALPTQAHAILVHGSPVKSEKLDRQLLERVADLYRDIKVEWIVLNGLSQAEAQDLNVAYAGHECWTETLISEGVKSKDIVLLPPSGNTAIEAKNYLAMAKESCWYKLLIATQPYHQLRCFLTAVALMDELDHLEVFNAPGPPIARNEPMYKPVPKGTIGGDVKGTLDDHEKAEYNRIIAYAQEPELDAGGQPKFTRHARFDEMFAYLDCRMLQ